MSSLSNSVHQYLQQIGLCALKKARDTGVGGVALGKLPASAVLESLVLPQIACLAMATRDNPSPERLEVLVASLTGAVERHRQPQAGREQFPPDALTALDQLPKFLEVHGQGVVADAGRVHAAWRAGIEVLDAVVPAGANEVRASVILIAGLEGPFGEVTAFSSPNFPGCIAFGTNNPPVLLAEEMLHEACHVRLWSRLAVDNRLSATFSDLPAIHSPFTESLRPAIRVLHGFVSYAAVLRYWQALKSIQYDPAAFGPTPGDRAAMLVERRIDILRQRIAAALSALGLILEGVAAKAFEDVVKELVGCVPAELSVPKTLPGVDQREYEAAINALDPISSAEYQLAITGAKVSRIVLPLAVASRLAAVNLGRRTLIAGGEAIRSNRDQRLGSFSNTASLAIDLLDAGPNDDVYLYVSNDPARALAAWHLDRTDEAAELFGIPSCCARFFRNHWDESRTLREGDVFETMLTKCCSDMVVRMHWACNAAAMYFGHGLCWHFPCAPDCPATISTIAERRRRLATIDQYLTQDLVAWMATPLIWSRAFGYGSLPTDGGLSTPLEMVVWLNAGVRQRTKETIAMWLAAAGDDTRKLIIPTAVENGP